MPNTVPPAEPERRWPYEERIRDKVLESHLALWAALLTVEGVLVAIGALLRLQPWELAALMVLCFVSMTLLVWNLLDARALFIRIGEVLHEKRPISNENVKQAGKARNWTRVREVVVFISTGLVMALLLCAAVRGGS